MAIVSSDDSRDVLDKLTKAGFRATVISTTGGFLREGNTTFFLGVDDHKIGQGDRDPAECVPQADAMGLAAADAGGLGLEMAEPIEVSVEARWCSC